MLRDTLPENFDAIETFWEFWDTHSTADYEDLMEDVDIRFNLESSKTYCAVASVVFKRIPTQPDEAENR